MKPIIDTSVFGSITVDGAVYPHDITISLEGKVRKRKKKLSKTIYGTSHKISLGEAEYVYHEGAEGIIIGSGQYGITELSEEAKVFFGQKHCEVRLLPTPEAVPLWNETEGKWLALFHVTC